MKKVLTIVSKVCAILFTLTFGIASVATEILLDNESAVNGAFNIVTQYEIPAETDADTVYYKSAFSSVSDVIKNGEKMVRGAVAEGSVLLKNENNALPIALNSEKKAYVSVFSVSSVGIVTAGAGSGSQGDPQHTTNLKQGFEAAGLMVNPDLWNWYNSNVKYTASSFGRVSSGSGAGDRFYTVNEAKWSEIGTSAKTNAEYGDAAIFILSRNGAENEDISRHYDRTDHASDCNEFTNGNYLALTSDEIDVLKNIKLQKDASVFKKSILVINSAYPFQMDFLADESLGIDAILWVGSLGTNGIYGVADLLTGAVTPSGKLSDTWFKNYLDNPAMYNFGDYKYSDNAGEKDMGRTTYVVYQEGIYVGYRYTETRYEDYVMGKEKVGAFDYANKVVYPFGYGLSYTDFEFSNMKTEYTASTDKYKVSVDVKNVGTVAGKQVVQVYVQKPYTDYDKQNKIEKPSVELINYGKTKTLAPQESETVTIEFSRRDLAAYDAYGAKTFVLDAGDYYVTVGDGAHEAINNILELKSGTQSVDKTKMVGTGNKDMAKVIATVANLDTTTYATAEVTGNNITNKFDSADLKRYGEFLSNPESPLADPYSTKDEANADSFNYITRSDWQGTMPTTNVKLARTAKMNRDDDVARGKYIYEDDVEYPTYGANMGDESQLIKLVELRGLDYNDQKWQLFLDQLTFDETSKLIRTGLRQTDGVNRLGKPITIDHNGSNGPTQAFNVGSNGFATRFNDSDKGKKPVIYPCSGIIASTFNQEFIDYFGRQWGEDCLWAGYSGLYGPSINIHRSAYNGRNFEYWSEDPVLSGKSVAALAKGMATRGVYVYLKHCALNDQETNRHGLNVWANEQCIREIYLKPFQIAIEEGGAAGVMTGFNCVGAKWTSAQGFCRTVLRDEYGMNGICVTDFYKADYPYMKLVPGVLNGNDLPDGNETVNVFASYKENYGEVAWAMRESAHRIMYTVANSNAMNFKTGGTTFFTVEPKWKEAVTTANSCMVYPFIFGLLFFAVVTVLDKLKILKD